MSAARLAVIGVAAVLVTAAIAAAQPRRNPPSPRYDKATEATVVGVVEAVNAHQGRAGGTGTHLSLKTDAGTLDVHVGPTNWLASKEFGFAAGDKLEVLGSKVKVDGYDAFIAREIRKGEMTLRLRNADGIPEWSGGRRAR